MNKDIGQELGIFIISNNVDSHGKGWVDHTRTMEVTRIPELNV